MSDHELSTVFNDLRIEFTALRSTIDGLRAEFKELKDQNIIVRLDRVEQWRASVETRERRRWSLLATSLSGAALGIISLILSLLTHFTR